MQQCMLPAPSPPCFLALSQITLAGQTSLAYVTAATHGLVEDAERLGEQLGELRPRIDAAHGERCAVGGLV